MIEQLQAIRPELALRQSVKTLRGNRSVCRAQPPPSIVNFRAGRPRSKWLPPVPRPTYP